MQTVVGHHHTDLGAELHAVIKLHAIGGHGILHGYNARCHKNVFVVSRVVRRMTDIRNDWTDICGTDTVGRTGCGRVKIIRIGTVQRCDSRAQLSDDQEIAITRAAVQSLNREHIIALPQYVLRDAKQINFLELARIGIDARTGCSGIPRGRVRRVPAGHKLSVHVRVKPVVVLNPQQQRVEI